nr:site-specific integrase [Gordonia humi]
MPDRRKRRRSFTSERAARAFEAELTTAKHQGRFIDPRRGDDVELRSVYDDWIATRQDVTAKVKRGFEDNWRLHVEPAFGSWPVSRVDRRAVQEWINGMDAAPRTIRWRHSVLAQVLDHAIAEGLAVRNVARLAVLPKLVEADHVYLTADEVEGLAAVCGDQGYVVTILAYTGLRWGELTGLNVGDVNLARRRIAVRRSMTQVGGKLTAGATKSRAGRRTVPIPGALVPLLRDLTAGRPRSAPVVMSPRGARLSRENWVRAVGWRERTAEIGYPNLRIHDLRHTYASLARSAGADLRLLQVAMGHASITVTAHTYADLYDDELDRIGTALDKLIDPTAEE